MQLRNNLLITFLVLFISYSANAQEALFDLRYNAVCNEANQNQFRIQQSNALSLPFIDDFSSTEITPDQSKWEDANVFINSAMCIEPPSFGVATFDGTDRFGFAYDPTFALNSYGGCDTLTSQLIDLSGVILGDSLYMSFFFQAGGNGDYPNSADSLVLEFKKPDSTWLRVWGSGGMQSAAFEQVIFYVSNEAFYHNAFQMRFRNYGQRTGINDLWHLDYVKLDVGRTSDDLLLQDVAFMVKPSSILTTYTQMPWHQFFDYQSTMLNPNHSITLRNNFDQISNTGYQYLATEMLNEELIFSTVEQSGNVYPFTIVDYGLESPEFLTDYNQEEVNILLEYFLNPAGDVNRNNDTMRIIQTFGNEFAYDDGIAERAYGVFGQSAEIAQKFVLNEADVLRAVKIHFTTIEEDQSNRLFNVKVWQNLAGIDNANQTNELATLDLQSPQYIYEANGFSTYELETPLPVTGEFYIGIQQDGADEMTIGFDVNNISNDKLYYSTAGSWAPSNIPGALMIRPVMGNGPIIASIDESSSFNYFDLSIFPNPAKNQISVKNEDNSIQNIQILSIIGQQLIKTNAQQGVSNINIADLEPGIYLLKAIDKEGNSQTKKFIKSN